MELELDREPVSLLVGPNGAGKSTVIEALIFLHNLAREGFYTSADSDDLLRLMRFLSLRPRNLVRWGESEASLGLEHEGESYEISLMLDESGVEVLGEPLWRVNPPLARAVRAWRFYYFYDIYEMGRNFKNLEFTPETSRQLYTQGTNAPQVLARLKIEEDEVYSKIQADFLELLSDAGFPDAQLTIRVDELVRLGIRFEEGHLWKEGGELPYRDWPDGWKKWLALLVAFHTAPPGSTVIMEEPENYIYPRALALLRELIEERAGEVSFVMTTHSPVLVNLFSHRPESLVVVEEGTARRLSGDDKILEVMRRVGIELGEAYYGGYFDE